LLLTAHHHTPRLLFFYHSASHRHLHSFPTRRSSDLTFQGKPWTVHGRKMYAYDPVSRQLIMVRPIRLTTGYDPKSLQLFPVVLRSEEHTSELQSRFDLVCRLLLEKKK